MRDLKSFYIQLVCCLLTGSFSLRASTQTFTTFTPYSTEIGFVQKEVMKLAQDEKGQMWFATWDGLYRFDGYRFSNYKARPGNGVRLESNRLETLCIDGHYVWMLGYNGDISCFNTSTSTIRVLPIYKYIAQSLERLKGGGVLITTKDYRVLLAHVESDSQEIEVQELKGLPSCPVHKVEQDTQGRLWILTAKGLYSCGLRETSVKEEWTEGECYDWSEHASFMVFCATRGTLLFRRKGELRPFLLPTTADLRCVKALNDGQLVIATDGDGLYITTSDGRIKQHYTQSNSALNHNSLNHLKKDRHDHIWFCTGKPGVMHLNTQNGELHHLEMQGEFADDASQWMNEATIVEDSHDRLWISPSGNGLALYDPKEERLIPYFDPQVQQAWTTENTLVDLFVDRQDNLWYCGKYTGLEKITFNTRQFYLLDLDGSTESRKDVRGLFQDRDGYIWVGAKNGTINVFDAQLNYLGNLSRTGEICPHCTDYMGRAYCFSQDEDGTLWIGTKFNGLLELKPKGNLRYEIHPYKAGDGEYDLVSNDLYALCMDRHHRLWIATYGGGLCYLPLDEPDRRFVSTRNRLTGYPKEFFNKARCLACDSDGAMWVGTTSGLLSFDDTFSRPEEILFRSYTRNPDDATSLSNNDILQVFFTHDREMYVCTYGGGFCHVTQQDGQRTFRAFTTDNGLRSDVVFSVQEDNNGRLWFSTENGLVKYDPATESIGTFSSRFFGKYIDINEGLAVHLKDGRLLFPSRNHGAMYFDPQQVRLSNYIPPIIFTRFFVGQEEQQPGGGILTCALDDTQKIKLPHDRNNFVLEFAALDYRDPNNLSYAFMLEGVDKEWSSIGNAHLVNYNNLLPGKYRLLVKSTNSDGVWTSNTRAIDIEVTPSFWQTGWALLLYLFLLVAVILVTSYILFTIFRLKQKVTIEKNIADLKLRFFTDISHEIRTPLTLISGSIKEILQRGVSDAETRESLTVVDNNSDRLVRLVNQLLDVRKLESGTVHLTLNLLNLGERVESTAVNFKNLAREQQIDFTVETPSTPILLWGDEDALDKIVFNLLSNAFRFTPSGKRIRVKVSREEEGCEIVVTDEGAGIAPERIEKIFQLFESTANYGAMQQSGSGIGLALTKELVELHHGTITVKSRLGEGSAFTVHLPEELFSVQPQAPEVPVEEMQKELAEETSESNELPTVLVVEDHPEMRHFLHKILQRDYRIYESANGQEGIEKVRQEEPDLIVTDYMMPVMNGLEMIRQLKSDQSTSHIPVLILSAKTDCDSKINGLESGADAYMEKPFSADMLRARIRNIVQRQEKTREYFRSLYLGQPTKEEDFPLQEADNDQSDFMSKLNEVLEKNISRGDLSVEEVASLLNMSRSVYFKKLKALTGLSPNEYLKALRMKRAADLIESRQYTIAEISVMVGINDPHYFSKCFKHYFKRTPTEWKGLPQKAH